MQNLRVLLQNEFAERCRRNPAYSMRAFAKFLEMDQSLLSKIMRNERGISRANTLKIGPKLKLSPSQIEHLARGKRGRDSSYTPLSDDEFNLISRWYHFAILELAKTKAFNADPKAISKRLGLHIEEARAALERLARLGLIQRGKNSWQLRTRDHSWSNTHATTEAKALLQKALLEKSLEAIDRVPYCYRDHGSVTVAIDKERLPEFKEKLKEIRRELDQFFQKGKNPSEVYQLSVSFFPLTDVKEGNG